MFSIGESFQILFSRNEDVGRGREYFVLSNFGKWPFDQTQAEEKQDNTPKNRYRR
jgi:hypothetical protein